MRRRRSRFNRCARLPRAHALLLRVRMAIAERLSRYKEFASFLAKYGRAEFVATSGDEPHRSSSQTRRMRMSSPTTSNRSGRRSSSSGSCCRRAPTCCRRRILEALARLQDDVEPFPFAEVERIVEERAGVRLSKAFDAFEQTPIAAASLGQVHRAVLRDGREVAVKVQRPGVREQVRRISRRSTRSPRSSSGSAARLAASTSPRVLEEFRRTHPARARLPQEARNLVALCRVSCATSSASSFRCRSTTTRRRAC